MSLVLTIQSGLVIGTALGVAVGLIAGIPLSIVGQRYLVAATRDRRELGYQILTANVIIPRLPRDNPAVKLTVKRAVLGTSLAGDPEEFVDVKEVYGFRVRVKNTGTRELLEQPVTFQFPAGTKIILADFEDAPELGAQSPVVATDNALSQTTVVFPFLNPKDEVKVSIQTVTNPSLGLKIVAASPGLVVYDLSKRSRARGRFILGILVMMMLIPSVTLLTLGLSGWFDSDTSRNLRGWSAVVFLFLAFPLVVGVVDTIADLRKKGRVS